MQGVQAASALQWVAVGFFLFWASHDQSPQLEVFSSSADLRGMPRF